MAVAAQGTEVICYASALINQSLMKQYHDHQYNSLEPLSPLYSTPPTAPSWTFVS